MTDTNPKTTHRRKQDQAWREIAEWVETVQPDRRDWEEIVRELQVCVVRAAADVDDTHQEVKVDLFEAGLARLLDALSTNMSETEKVRVQLRAARSFETLGDWDKALANYQNITQLPENDAIALLKAEAFRWIGHIYCMRNEWHSAQTAYQRSLWLGQEYSDPVQEASAISSLGILAFEQGDIERAADDFEQALSIAERAGALKLVAEIRNNLGAVENVRGKWANALAIYSQSLPVAERLGEVRTLAEIHHNIAMTYADMQRWADAGINYRESLLLARECGDLRLQATVKLNRVELYLTIGDYDFAAGLSKQALAIFNRLQDRLGEADAHKLLGVIQTAQRQWSEARQSFSSSIRLARQYKSPMCEAESHLEFGKMWQKKGNRKSAQKQFGLALKQFASLKAEPEVAIVKALLKSLQ